MLAQAAISIANTQRRILDHVLARIQKDGNAHLPATLRSSKRHHSYEVTVVDQFYQLGQQSFAHHGSVAMWERPVHDAKSGRQEQRGRPSSVDISLFNAKKGEESRIEFGVYSKDKLKKDAKKLAALSEYKVDKYPNISNYVILWDDRRTPLTKDKVVEWSKKCEKAAKDASTKTYTVKLQLVSSADLFCEDTSQPRVSDVALFSIMKPVVTNSTASDESSNQDEIDSLGNL